VESLAIRAELDCVRGKVLYELGATGAANRHFDRAIRVNHTISHTAARAHVKTSRLELLERHANRLEPGHGATESDKAEYATGSYAAELQGLESAAYLLVFANRPEVLGLEAFELLVSTRLTESITLVANDGSLQHIVKKHHPHVEPSTPTKSISIPLGKTAHQDFVLVVRPIPTLAAQSYVMALATIVRAAVASEEMRRDNLRRNSVWPAEDDSEQQGALFGSQRMHQVCWEARKAAKSDLTILFTGETGVGKEVLAREIHRQSLRAD